MAYEGIQRLWGASVAAADLSTKQYCCVDLDTTAAGSQIALASSAGQTVFGVLQDKPTLGQPASVCVDGFTKVKVGSTGFTAGDNVTTDATGAVVTANGSTQRIIGRAMVTAVSGTIGTILLRPASAQS